MQNEDTPNPVTTFIQALARELDVLRKQGYQITGQVGPEVYRNVLLDTGNVTFSEAVKFIQDLGLEGIPSLTSALLGSEDSTVRMAAAMLLAELNSKAVNALPALITALKDEDWQVRCWCLIVIAEIGSEATSAIPYVVDYLADQHGIVARIAGAALVHIGSEVVPLVVNALNNPNDPVRFKAARVLEELGPAALSALPTLVSKVKSETSYAKLKMVEALGSIGSKEALPFLEELKSDATVPVALVIQAIEKIIESNKDPDY